MNAAALQILLCWVCGVECASASATCQPETKKGHVQQDRGRAHWVAPRAPQWHRASDCQPEWQRPPARFAGRLGASRLAIPPRRPGGGHHPMTRTPGPGSTSALRASQRAARACGTPGSSRGHEPRLGPPRWPWFSEPATLSGTRWDFEAGPARLDLSSSLRCCAQTEQTSTQHTTPVPVASGLKPGASPSAQLMPVPESASDDEAQQ